MMIAWAAESAQFFIAQGFALAILAWLQTLPEFAVEFVLAWHQQVPLLMANLTGALRLLVGLGWPLIYVVAAFFHRRRYGGPLRRIKLEDQHSVEVIGVIAPLCYMFFVWYKATLTIWDAVALIGIYTAYLWVLSKLPPEAAEGVENLEAVPRAIVKSPPMSRSVIIAALFVAGGALIYFSAEPFLGSLLAISTLLGIPAFVFVQWVAPLVSEFPEKVSAIYWARTVQRAPMALMNMVASNINQWTLLAAMLPVVYSISRGSISVIPLDAQQQLELLLTLAQSLVAAVFLINMELAWWEATALFTLWAVQFAFSPVSAQAPGRLGFIAAHIHWWVTLVYLGWAALGTFRMLLGYRNPTAFRCFATVLRTHVMRGDTGA